MEDVESFGPRFAVAWRAADAAEGAGLGRVWIGIIFEVRPQDDDAFGTKSSENPQWLADLRDFFATGPADQLAPAAILRYLAALNDRLRADLRPTNCSFRLRVADGKHGFESRTGFPQKASMPQAPG